MPMPLHCCVDANVSKTSDPWQVPITVKASIPVSRLDASTEEAARAFVGGLIDELTAVVLLGGVSVAIEDVLLT